MKNYISSLLHFDLSTLERWSVGALERWSVSALLLFSFCVFGEPGKSFSTPEEAVRALGQAVNASDRGALRGLFGSDSDWLTNPDPVQGERELKEFTAAFNASNHLTKDSQARMTLEVGTNAWPFPIPVVKTNGAWRFDTEAGREEVLNRRIGANELEVLQIMRVYVQAQREYASQDRDGDTVLEYAQKIASSPGKTDGLYWPIELNGERSPLGPLAAEAQAAGYSRKQVNTEGGLQPFHGYYFKILKRQGTHAPGGKYDYVINGNMIAGFALVAWPAEHDESGIMTFIVNQQGRVYQKDLGPKTASIASKMSEYDPGPGWQLSPD